jgi:hypothetical protein
MSEELRQRPGDQPLPTEGQENVQDALIERIKERRALGVQRYGRPLQTFNGRVATRDLLEELLDGATYAMQVQMEWDATQTMISEAVRLHSAGEGGLCVACFVESPCHTRQILTRQTDQKVRDAVEQAPLNVTQTDPVGEIVCSPDAIEEVRRRFGVTEAQTGLPTLGSLMGFPVFVDDELPPGTVRMQPNNAKQ